MPASATYSILALATGLLASASAYAAEKPMSAPPGTQSTRYCMRVEAITGSRMEPVACWTRAQWEDQGVDIDRDWAKEGVRTID